MPASPPLHWEKAEYDASFFAKANNPSKTFAAKQLARVASLLPTDAPLSALDIGCGDGEVTVNIEKIVNVARRASQLPTLAFQRIDGIDISAGMIAFAQKTYAAHSDKVKFNVLKAQEISLKQQYSLVFSSLALHWVSAKELAEKVFPQIKQSLRPGGVVSITFGLEHPHLFQAVFDTMKTDTFKAYFKDFVDPYHFYDEVTIAEMLTASGFESVSAKVITEEYTFDRIEDLMDNISSWMPYFSQVPKDKRDLFKQVVGEKYLEKVASQADSKVNLTSRFLDVKGSNPELVPTVKPTL